MPGAGYTPAGSTPAGLDIFAPTLPAPNAVPVALFLDPFTGRFATDPKTGLLLELDEADAEVAWISAVERGSLPIFPDRGNVFRQYIANAIPTQRMNAAQHAANDSYAALLARGDITITKVDLDDIYEPKVVVMTYVNNRATDGRLRAPRVPLG